MNQLLIKIVPYSLIFLLMSMLVYQWKIYHSAIAVIDLGKIITAESILTNKVVEGGQELKPWLATVNSVGKELKSTISEVAGKNTIVLISPCVVQGARNITNDVLVKLGLPRAIPNSAIPMNAIFHNYNKNSNEKIGKENEKIPEWMLP